MNQPYDIFFTGSTNPRECIMIGGIRGTEDAIYLEFRTPNIPAAETQTTVSAFAATVYRSAYRMCHSALVRRLYCPGFTQRPDTCRYVRMDDELSLGHGHRWHQAYPYV
ncbi:hypothetical protein NM688_g3100 [Phlebia brevispora]|uniref:Uncharacterized protein n=1 Tax=Phlebia brevispora TaxID=194682 RepID=A0ACC1T739_9APHY|nr:hypothetical protein NM688_g3100 [Phlebia brevispora]